MCLLEAAISVFLAIEVSRYFYIVAGITAPLGTALLVLAWRVDRGRSFGAAAAMLLLVAFLHACLCAVVVYYASTWGGSLVAVATGGFFCLTYVVMPLSDVADCLKLRARSLGTYTETTSQRLVSVIVRWLASLQFGLLGSIFVYVLSRALGDCMRDPSIENVAGILLAAGLSVVGFTAAILCLRSALTWNAGKSHLHSWEERLSNVALSAGLTLLMIGVVLLVVSRFD